MWSVHWKMAEDGTKEVGRCEVWKPWWEICNEEPSERSGAWGARSSVQGRRASPMPRGGWSATVEPLAEAAQQFSCSVSGVIWQAQKSRAKQGGKSSMAWVSSQENSLRSPNGNIDLTFRLPLSSYSTKANFDCIKTVYFFLCLQVMGLKKQAFKNRTTIYIVSKRLE